MAQRTKGRSRRRKGRILAPAALIASTVAVVMVVSAVDHSGTRPDPRKLERRAGSTSNHRTKAQGARSTASAPAGSATPGAVTGGRTATVQAGDTPSSIAQRAGIPLARLLALNPGLKPTALQVGQKLEIGP